MVSIVAGSGLGLTNTSKELLGQAGELGQAGTGKTGEQVRINAATGNLIIQDQDDLLMAVGLNAQLLRTYNSRGDLDGDNNDGWRVGFYRSVAGLTGNANRAGSTITRVGADGLSVVYTFDTVSNKYVGRDGAGAYDTLDFAKSPRVWTWQDGTTGVVESYEETSPQSGSWRLTQVSDPDGNANKLFYNADGTIQRIETWASRDTAARDTVILDYTASKQLQSVRVTYQSGGQVQTRTLTRYGYDAQGRLASVTTDLSPDDNSTADGKVYTTTYRYDGNSNRVAAVLQSDGTNLAISYVQVGSGWQVATVTDALGRVTRFDYDIAHQTTTVTDAAGQTSVLSFDSAQRLTAISGALAGGASRTEGFSYDTAGNLATHTNQKGEVATYTYANGNLTHSQDAAGNVVDYTYDNDNNCIAITRYLTPAQGTATASAPLVTRYVYDRQRHLCYSISPEGRVTSYDYNGYGQRVSAIDYSGTRYTGSTAALGDLKGWASNVADKSRVERTDYTYDFRGQLSTSTRYASVRAGGDGTTDGTQSVIQYVYDPFGRLLQTIDPLNKSTVRTFDGLGRVLTEQDRSGYVTTTTYDDAGRRTTIVHADNTARVAIYDAAGELISTVVGSAASQAVGATITAIATTRYAYDKLGRLAYIEDPAGCRTFTLYDTAGREVASIDAAGVLTETVRDANGLAVQTITYANALSTASLASLADAGGVPLTPALDSLRPAVNALDRITTNFYDAAHRLVGSQDAEGRLTQSAYDGAGHLVSTTRYATLTKVTRGVPSALQDVLPLANPNDRLERNFFDSDGRLLGTLDAEGYLTEYEYDAAGRQVAVTRYDTSTTPAFRTAGTLDAIRPVKSLKDIRSITLYDAQDRIVGQIDGEGYFTETQYNAAGLATQTLRYDNKIAPTVVANNGNVSYLDPATLNVKDLRSNRVEVQTVVRTYTARGEVATETAADGTVTSYVYNVAGQLTRKNVAINDASQERDTRYDYDAAGRQIAEVSAIGLYLLEKDDALAQSMRGQLGYPASLAALTASQRTSITNLYSLRHSYDAAGRRISTTDGRGNKTLFYYDVDGRLNYSINAAGEVSKKQYDAFGQVTNEVAYSNRLTASTLTGLTGGQVTSALANAVSAMASATDGISASVYSAAGLLKQRSDVQGLSTQYGYNAFGEVQSSVATLEATRTLTTSYAYDHRGLRLQTVSDAAGMNVVVASAYDAYGRAVSTTDGRGKVTTTEYDKLGHVLVLRDPRNAKHSTTYDAFGRVLTQTDAMESVDKYVYDTSNRRLTLTTAQGVTTITEVNRFGQTLTVTDGNKNTTRYAYDLNGELLTVTDAAGGTISNTYDSVGNVILTTDPNGTATQFKYDAANRRFQKLVDPGGLALTTTYVFDGQGRSVTVTDPVGAVTRNEYDAAGHLAAVVRDDSGLKLRTEYAYDAAGKTLKVTEGAGTAAARTTRYAYDALGRRTSEVVDPDGLALATGYSYDRAGNVIAKRDALGNITRYVYDDAGRLSYTIDAAGAVSAQSYDDEGRVTQIRRYARAINIASLPNLADPQTGYSVGQVQALIVPDSADPITRTAYDLDGRPLYTVDAAGEVTGRRFDGNGNVIQLTRYARPVTGVWTDAQTLSALIVADPADRISYTVYDAANRAVYDIDALCYVTRLEYDAAGNTTAVTRYANAISVPASRTPDSVAAALHASTDDCRTVSIFDAAGRRLSEVDAEGYLTEWRYDAAGRVTTKIRYAKPLPTGGDYTSVASLASMRSLAGGALSAAFTRLAYDSVGRLTGQIDAEGYYTEYTYSAAGDRISERRYANRVGPSNAAQAPVTGSRQGFATNLLQNPEFVNLDANGLPQGWISWISYSTAGTDTQLTRGANLNADWEVAEPQFGEQTYYLRQAGVSAAANACVDTYQVVSIQAGHKYVFSAYTGAHRSSVVAYIAWVAADGSWIKASGFDADSTNDQQASGGSQLSDYKRVYAQDVAPAGAVKAVVALRKNNTAAGQADSWLFATEAQFEEIPVSASGPTDWKPRVAESAGDASTFHVFDSAGRERYTIAGDGSVSETRYDAAGHVTGTSRYQQRIVAAPGMTESDVQAALRIWSQDFSSGASGLGTLPSQMSVSGGRLVVTATNAAGAGVTWPSASGTRNNPVGTRYHAELTLDNSGSNRFAFYGIENGQSIASGSFRRHAVQFVGAAIQVSYYDPSLPGGWGMRTLGVAKEGASYVVEIDTDAAGTTLYVYEKGKSRADGFVDRRDFSDWGSSRTQICTRNDPSAGAISRTWFDFLEEGSPEVQSQSYAYGATGQRIKALDANGAAVTTSYDALGNAVSSIDSRGGVSYSSYDLLGRVVQRIDAARRLTVYGYDAFGNLTSTTSYSNPVQGTLGMGPVAVLPSGSAAPAAGAYLIVDDAYKAASVTSFDKLNRATDDTNPLGIESAILDAFGNKRFTTNRLGGTAIFTYDHLGRLLSETLPVQARNASGTFVDVINSYSYDALGNRIQSVEGVSLPEQRSTTYRFDKLGRLVAKVGEAVTVVTGVGVSSTVTPTESVSYDANGNEIERIDANGARTLSYYDAANRRVAQLTEQQAGNPSRGALQQWSYDGAGNVVSLRRYGELVALPLAAGGSAPVPVNSSNVRETLFTYDGAGRQINETVKSVLLGELNESTGAYNVFSGDILTRKYYDAAGNLIEEVDGRGNSTFHFYDAVGRQIFNVDAENYVTAWSYGPDSVTQTRYANPLGIAVNRGSDPAGLTPTSSSEDRITVSSLDKAGRVVHTQVRNVAYGKADAANFGNYSDAVGTAETYTQYDALGNIISRTDADGTTLICVYDKLGRKISETVGSYTSYANVTVSQRTVTEYNGLGLIARETELDRDDTTSSGDRLTTYTYNKAGGLTQVSRPIGATAYGYDAAGNLTWQQTLVRDADGAYRLQCLSIQYDRAGREVWRRTQSRPQDQPTAWTYGDVYEVRYDAFGEITGKRVNGGGADAIWQETSEYDVLGRVSKSNSGSGVTRLYVYDANGNATLSIASTGRDLSGSSISDGYSALDTAKTITAYNRRNLASKTVQPTFDGLQTEAAMLSATGNVAGGSVYVGGVVSVVSSNTLPAINSTAPLGHVNATSVVAGSTMAGSFSGKLVAVNAVTTYGTFPTTSGVYNFYVDNLSLPLPNLGWYGDGSYEVVYTDGSGTAQSTVDAGAAQASVAIKRNVSGNYTIGVYKWVDGTTKILVASASGNYGGFGSWSVQGGSKPDDRATSMVATINLNPVRQFEIAGQPAGTASIDFAVTDSNGKVNNYKAAQVLVGGHAVAGWFALDYSAWATGNYTYTYIAKDASGNVVNTASGMMTVETMTASITHGAVVVSGSISGSANSKPQATSSASEKGVVVGQAAGVPLGATFSGSNVTNSWTGMNGTIPVSGSQKYFLADSLTFSLPAGLTGMADPDDGFADFRLVIDGVDAGGVSFSLEKPVFLGQAPYTVTIGKSIKSYAATLYQNIKGVERKVAAGSGTFAVSSSGQTGGNLHFTTTSTPTSASATLNTIAVPQTCFINNLAQNTAAVYFYWRVAGSGAAFNCVSLPRYNFTDGSHVVAADLFEVDPAKLGLASGTTYEFQYCALSPDASGKLGVSSHQGGTLYNAGINTAFYFDPAQGKFGGDGFTVFEAGNQMRFWDQGRGNGAPVPLTSAVIRLRAKGSNDWVDYSKQLSVSSTTIGLVSLDWSGLSGEYDFDLRCNGTGGEVNHVVGHLVLGAKPQVMSYSTVAAQPSAVTFHNQPTNAVTLSVSYRAIQDGKTLFTGKVGTAATSKSSTESNAFVWDASGLVPDVLSTYLYEYTIEARDSGNQLVNKATGQIYLGANASVSGDPVSTRSPTKVEFAPPNSSATSMTLYYRVQPPSNVGATAVDDDLYSVVPYSTVTLPVSGGKFVWDASAVRPTSGSQAYDYFYDLFDAAGNRILRNSGTFRLGDGAPQGVNEVRWSTSTTSTNGILIGRQVRYNAFGEIKSEIDGRGYANTLKYNTLGLLIEKDEPQVSVTAENGAQSLATPVTQYRYSLGGRLVKKVDANNNATTYGYLGTSDAEGNAPESWERDAAGNFKRYTYDEFGNRRSFEDELHAVTSYDYDAMDRLVKITRPQRAAGTVSYIAGPIYETFAYDELGHQVAHTNAVRGINRTYYDDAGRVTKTIDADGLVTTIAYGYSFDQIYGVAGKKVGGWQKVTTVGVGTGDAHTSYENSDYFGHATWRRDQGGHDTTLIYNGAGWLTSQTSTAGQNITYGYYANGYIASIRDNALKVETDFNYDENGNRTFEGRKSIVTAAGDHASPFENVKIVYDALGRIVRATDPRADLQYEYDAVGNVRHIHSEYNTLNGSEQKIQDLWYAYDSLNRFVITQGALIGERGASGTHIDRGTSGITIAYDAASRRKSATYGTGAGESYTGYSTDGHTETYSYTNEGYLETVRINGVLVNSRKSDAAGRVVENIRYGSDGVSIADRLTTTYAAGGMGNRVERTTDAATTNGKTTTATSAYTYQGDGQLKKIVQSQPDGPTITTDYSYVYWDDAKQSAINVSGKTGYGMDDKWNPGSSSFSFDVNGHASGTTIYDKSGYRSFKYVNDAQGMVLSRDEQVNGQTARTRMYFYVNGARVGDVSNDGPSREDYAQAMQQLAQTDKDKDYRDFKPIYSADFDQNYEPVSPSYPGAASGSYTAQGGETLESVAQAVWGDGAMWYLIADANGLTGQEQLEAGQVLVIPNKITNIHHNASTQRVYNPGEAMGKVDPVLPAPPPPPESGCGGIGMILMIVVAVIVTIYTAGAAAGLFASAATATGTASAAAVGAGTLGASVVTGAAGVYGISTGAMMASAAIGAAAGSIASQGVGMAMGLQHGFSWKQVGLSALGGAVTAGVGSMFAEGGWLASSPIMQAGARGFASAAVTQGLQGKWSWQGVAAAAAGSAAGAAVSGQISSNSTFADVLGGKDGLGSRMVSGMAGTALGQLVGAGKVDPRSAFVNTLGNALGDSMVNSMQPRDELGDFINEKLAEQDARDRYGLASAGPVRFGRSTSDAVADWSARVDQGIAYASRRLPADGLSVADSGGMSADELASRRSDVEEQLRFEILGQEARDASVNGAQLFMTGGPVRNMPRGGIGNFEMVRNGNWDAALNIGADPLGLLGELAGLQSDLAQLSRIQAEKRIEGMRQAMIGAGVKGVPGGFSESWVTGADGTARNVRDYGATVNELQGVYENHVRDQRLRETWGDDYQNVRIGKSQMTVMDFEKRVLDIHLSATDRAYAAGVDAIAKGEMQVKPGDYAQELGNFIDRRVRGTLRDFARAEGINDSPMSNLWAINRRIRNEYDIGIPDNRLGFNLYADTTLARKNAYTPQIMKWNDIRAGNFLIIRPTELGGAYVIPRASIPQPKPVGRGI